MNENTLPSRHKILNYTLNNIVSLEGTLEYYYHTTPREGFFSNNLYCLECGALALFGFNLEFQRGVRTRDLRLSKQAAPNTAQAPRS